MKHNLRLNNLGIRSTVLIALMSLVVSAASTRAQSYSLGTATLLEGPGAGSNSVVLAVSPTNATWTAMPNASWLHLSGPNQSGTGSTNVVFGLDANPGTTRSGTLTIAGQTLTVTQAGSTYVAVTGLTWLYSALVQEFEPFGVAVDGSGNVYYTDTENNVVWKWTAANDSEAELVPFQLDDPLGVAVDGMRNVYIADTGDNAIKEWRVANSTLSTLVSSNVSNPTSVAVDGTGNVYFTSASNNAIQEWLVANSNVMTLATNSILIHSLAVDVAGNVYFPSDITNALHKTEGIIQKWTAANNTITTLLTNGSTTPSDVAVDGSGNVYFSISDTIEVWTAANNAVTTLASNVFPPLTFEPHGMAVDGTGNVYFGAVLDSPPTMELASLSIIGELPYAFVDTTPKMEEANAGSDTLPVVLPATENLLPPFSPNASAAWLFNISSSNGVVSFSFTSNTGTSNRTANITVLGQSIPITQTAPVPPPTLISATMPSNGRFQFAFTNSNQSATFTVLTTTNIAQPLTNWTIIGMASNISPGLFQFTDTQATNSGGYYRARSP